MAVVDVNGEGAQSTVDSLNGKFIFLLNGLKYLKAILHK